MTVINDDTHHKVQMLLDFCSAHDDISECMAEIERVVSHIHGNASISLYLLDRPIQNFKRYSTNTAFPERIEFNYSAAHSIREWKCYRGNTQIGTILIAHSEELDLLALKQISNIICIIYERMLYFAMIAVNDFQIYYHQSKESFFHELRSIAQLSAHMPLGVLQEFDAKEGTLTPRFAWDLKNDDHLSSWDISSAVDIPAITSALATLLPKVIETTDATATSILGRLGKDAVRNSVICPVIVGTEVFGILSLAQYIPYEYSRVEIASFSAIAHMIGVAVYNFRRAVLYNEQVELTTRAFATHTALEVAQSTRHSVRAEIDNVNYLVASLLYQTRSRTSADLRVSHDLSLISEHMSAISGALDNIRYATAPFRYELLSTNLKATWDQAVDQLRGKLVLNNISCAWIGTDVVISCFPDQLRMVFLNLIINSIDAFNTLGRGSRKKNISIRVELFGKSHGIKLTYVDNAGGLDIKKLQRLKSDTTPNFSQMIFDKDVTTKDSYGGGWGLYICRRVVDRHGGSIDVVDYRGGMTFVIKLPTNLQQDP